MPKFVRPNSDSARLTFLEKCHAEIADDAVQERRMLHRGTRRNVDELLTNFGGAMQQIAHLQAERERLDLLFDETMAPLRYEMHDSWAALKKMVHRKQVSEKILDCFGMEAEGNRPKYSGRDGFLQTVGYFVAGNAKAREMGFDGLELKHAELLEEGISIFDQLDDNERLITQAQSKRNKLHAAVERLCSTVRREIIDSLFDKDASHQRQIMRHYGLVFRGDGEGGGKRSAASKATDASDAATQSTEASESQAIPLAAAAAHRSLAGQNAAQPAAAAQAHRTNPGEADAHANESTEASASASSSGQGETISASSEEPAPAIYANGHAAG